MGNVDRGPEIEDLKREIAELTDRESDLLDRVKKLETKVQTLIVDLVSLHRYVTQ